MTLERKLNIALALNNILIVAQEPALEKRIERIKKYTQEIENEIIAEEGENEQKEQMQWVEITTRPLTDEEKEDEAFNEFDYIYTCETPDNAQDVLITTRNGYVAQTTFYTDYGCYFENFEDLGDVLAWRPLPEPFYKEQKEREGSK